MEHDDSPTDLPSACPVTRWQHAMESTIREKPLESVVVAALGGLLLQRIPVRSLVVTVIRAAFTLLKPVLVLATLWKIGTALRDCCAEEEETG